MIGARIGTLAAKTCAWVVFPQKPNCIGMLRMSCMLRGTIATFSLPCEGQYIALDACPSRCKRRLKNAAPGPSDRVMVTMHGSSRAPGSPRRAHSRPYTPGVPCSSPGLRRHPPPLSSATNGSMPSNKSWSQDRPDRAGRWASARVRVGDGRARPSRVTAPSMACSELRAGQVDHHSVMPGYPTSLPSSCKTVHGTRHPNIPPGLVAGGEVRPRAGPSLLVLTLVARRAVGRGRLSGENFASIRCTSISCR
jgi:hypothetical protein